MDSAKSINGVFNILTDKIITLDELTKISPCNRHETIKIMSRLVSHGAVERLENGVYRLTDYGKSLKKSGEFNIFRSGPRGQYNRNKHSDNTLRTRVWRLMILNRKATIGELISIAADGPEKDPVSNVRKYLRALVKSGHLYEMPLKLRGSSPTSNGFKQYMLALETGRKAPVYRSDKKEVYDPNTGEVFKW